MRTTGNTHPDPRRCASWQRHGSPQPDDAVPLLVDWEGLSIGLGAWDLARLIHHTNLDEATLVRFETLALKNYHRALMTSGVTNYSEDDLQIDYRLSILAYVPHTLAWGNGANMGIAMRALERWNALKSHHPPQT